MGLMTMVLVSAMSVPLNALNLGDGLVGYWPLNGSWNDVSGNHNNMTPGNGPTFTTGKFDEGAYFDGVNDYAVSTSQLALTDKNTFTASIWVRSTDAGLEEETCAQVLGDHPTTAYWTNATLHTGKPWVTPIEERRYWSGWYANGDSGYDNQWEIVGPQTAGPEEWTNMVGVWQRQGSNVNVTLYVNGTSIQTRTSGLIKGGLVNSWAVLGNQCTLQSHSAYKGTIDDFAVWNRALSSEEILAISQGATIPEPLTISLLAGVILCVVQRR